MSKTRHGLLPSLLTHHATAECSESNNQKYVTTMLRVHATVVPSMSITQELDSSMATNLWSDDGFQVSNMSPNSGTVQCHSMDTGLTATGSTAVGALPLVSSINILGTVAASTGVRLPAVVAPGALVDVINGGASVLTVYPPTGGKVNGGSTDAADASTVAAVSAGVPGKQRYVQNGLNSGVPTYLRIG